MTKRHLVARYVLGLTVALLPGAASGQTARSAATYQVAGSVYDSVSKLALGGAVVNAILLDSAGTPTYTSISDSAGRFLIANLPRGRYALMFEHNALDVLGVDPPIDTISIADNATVNLAVPGGKTVRAWACRNQSGDGLFAGQVTAARTGQGLLAAPVFVRWSEVAIDHRKFVRQPREAQALTDSTGRFRICGLPLEGDLAIEISAPGFRPIDLDLPLGAGGALRRDFRLAELYGSDASSSVRFHVTDTAHAGITSGEVEILSLGRVGRIDSGRAVVSRLPAGTWVADVRALGYEPATVTVDAPSATDYSVILNPLPHLLENVTVRGKAASRDTAVIEAAKARLRSADGTLIRADDIGVRNATQASEALSSAAGFVRKGETKFEARFDVRGPCRSISEADSVVPRGTKTIAIYLDGFRVPGGLMAVNRMVPPKDILAIEAYPDVISAPAQWRQNDTCAVIVFWTKDIRGRK